MTNEVAHIDTFEVKRVSCTIDPDFNWGLPKDEKPVDQAELRRILREEREQTERDQAALTLYRRIKYRASKKGMEFDITLPECYDLGPCEYCGGESTGFDRVDSGKGYVPENIVCACGTCNTMKMRMTTEEFLTHIRRILAFTGESDES
ncbi:MAG: hypothetical protein OER87_07520 [Gammaproteobacteria bacterium]|nr:hypothetical protein [Gammaproteobacteria bacterium]MDH3535577.1 hypothetical protein [Gammaproteobacteria bacterium]